MNQRTQQAAIVTARGTCFDSEGHIKPLADYREHVSDRDCWCHPTPDPEDPEVIIHHAMDEREQYEEGRKLS